MSAISERLVRLLNMVPYFQANPKITYAEAASDLGVSVKQLQLCVGRLGHRLCRCLEPGQESEQGSEVHGGHLRRRQLARGAPVGERRGER